MNGQYLDSDQEMWKLLKRGEEKNSDIKLDTCNSISFVTLTIGWYVCPVEWVLMFLRF